MKPNALPLPQEALPAALSRVPGHIRRTFLAACILGLGTHLYMFANKLPNHDDMGHMFGTAYGTQSGRWFLPVVLQWNGGFSMPWLTGAASILCLAVVACLVVSLLRIRSTPGCVTAAALLVSFPSVAATFSYMFTADAYCFGTLLAALGAWTAVRFRRWGVPLGIVCITLSMGIYQSYFPLAAGLMVGALFFETLDGETTFRRLILRGLRLAAVLAVSMAAYLIVVRITTRETGLVDYMGISTMGQLSLSQLPVLIARCYWEFWALFRQNGYGFHLDCIRTLCVLTALAAIALLVLVLRRRKLGGLRTALAVVLVILYPLAANLIRIMTAGGRVHSLMIYGMVLLPVAPVAMADYAVRCVEWPPLSGRTARAALSWVILGSMALTAWSYMIYDNEAYLKLQLTFEQTTAYSNRLLSAVETCEDYEQGLPVVLVGSSTTTGDLYPSPILNTVQLTGVLDLSAMRTSYTYAHFLRYFLGYTGAVCLDGSKEAETLADTEEVQAMPVYPNDGSVRRVGDYMVVKLGEPAE